MSATCSVVDDRRRGRRGACRRRPRAPRAPSRSRAARPRAGRPRRGPGRARPSPAIATVSNARPTVRTSRSGVAPRNVVPSRTNANVVLSGAVRARCRRAATTSRSASAPVDDAPGQHDLVDPAATDGAGEQADGPVPGGAVRPLVDRREQAGAGSRVASASAPRPARRGQVVPRALDVAPASRPSPLVRADRDGQARLGRRPGRQANVGRTSEAAPNGAQGSSVAGGRPVNPSPPRRVGPASGTSAVAATDRVGQRARARPSPRP